MQITKPGMFLLTLVLIIVPASAADVVVIPSAKTAIQGQTFDLNVSIDPRGIAIAGAQLNIAFNQSILNVNSITEGNLFKQNGANTFFNGGVIDNSYGTVINIYSAILGPFNVSTPGTFIVINATAIGSGASWINLSNLKISDPNGVLVAVNMTNGSVSVNQSKPTTVIVNTTTVANQTVAVNATEIANTIIELNSTISVPVTLEITTSTDASSLAVMPATSAYGLSQSQSSIGKYVQVNVTNLSVADLNFVNITVFYTVSDLDRNGDGDASDPGDVNEQTSKIYWFNPTTSLWMPLGPDERPDYTSLGGPKVLHSERNTTAKYLKVTLNHFSTFVMVGELVTSQVSGGGGSGGGGGGGGGGGISAENATNIEVKEKYDLHIFKDIVTSYTFTNNSNPILFVNITGNVSAGEINVAVEVLRNTSSLVNNSPEGVIYKNVNIWVGTSGFATPTNIKQAEITFRVPKAWIETNKIDPGSINMARYDGGWKSLPTQKIIENTDEVNYVAGTNSFSPLAITGKKSEVKGISLFYSVIENLVPLKTAISEKAVNEPESHRGLDILFFIGAFVAVATIVYGIRKTLEK